MKEREEAIAQQIVHLRLTVSVGLQELTRLIQRVSVMCGLLPRIPPCNTLICIRSKLLKGKKKHTRINRQNDWEGVCVNVMNVMFLFIELGDEVATNDSPRRKSEKYSLHFSMGIISSADSLSPFVTPTLTHTSLGL